MNDLLAAVARGLFRVLVVVAGLVLFASLLAAAAMLAVVWGLRALWARLTGQPVAAWRWRVDPRASWQTVNRYAEQRSSTSRRGGVLEQHTAITDVEVKEPRS